MEGGQVVRHKHKISSCFNHCNGIFELFKSTLEYSTLSLLSSVFNKNTFFVIIFFFFLCVHNFWFNLIKCIRSFANFTNFRKSGDFFTNMLFGALHFPDNYQINGARK